MINIIEPKTINFNKVFELIKLHKKIFWIHRSTTIKANYSSMVSLYVVVNGDIIDITRAIAFYLQIGIQERWGRWVISVSGWEGDTTQAKLLNLMLDLSESLLLPGEFINITEL